MEKCGDGVGQSSRMVFVLENVVKRDIINLWTMAKNIAFKNYDSKRPQASKILNKL